MGSVNFFCEREVKLDKTIWIKGKVYHDPGGKLEAGRKVYVENPLHPNFKNQGRLYVYDQHKFLITYVELLRDYR